MLEFKIKKKMESLEIVREENRKKKLQFILQSGTLKKVEKGIKVEKEDPFKKLMESFKSIPNVN